MDFESFKKKALKFKNDTIDKAAKSLAESKLVIKTKEDLEKAIEKSENTSFTNKETGNTKEFTKHSVIVFTGKNTNFYKEFLVSIPVLATKAWSQSIFLRICDFEEKDLKKYKIKEFPSLVLFTNEKLEKIIFGEENIKKIVKSLDFNIIKEIENIDNSAKEL